MVLVWKIPPIPQQLERSPNFVQSDCRRIYFLLSLWFSPSLSHGNQLYSKYIQVIHMENDAKIAVKIAWWPNYQQMITKVGLFVRSNFAEERFCWNVSLLKRSFIYSSLIQMKSYLFHKEISSINGKLIKATNLNFLVKFNMLLQNNFQLSAVNFISN